MCTPSNTLAADSPSENSYSLPGLGTSYVRKLENCGRLLYTLFGPADEHNITASPDAIDRWFLHLLNTQLVEAGDLCYRKKDPALARLLHQLVIREFSRWYLELIKVTDQAPDRRAARKGTVFLIFKQLLKLNYPFFPTACREIQRRLFGPVSGTLKTSEIEGYRGSWIYPEEFREVESLKEIIRLIRNNRHRNNPDGPDREAIHIETATVADYRMIKKYQHQISRLSGVSALTVHRRSRKPGMQTGKRDRYGRWRISTRRFSTGQT